MTRNRTYELVHTVEHDEMSYPIDEEGWGNALKVAQFYGWPPEHSCPEWYVEPDARLVSEEDARSMGQALGKVVDDLPNLPSDGRTVLERMGGFAKQDSKALITFLMRCSFTINKGV